MKEIEDYIELHDEIARCDFRIAVLREEEADCEELQEVEVLKTDLQNKIAPLTEALSAENLDGADQLRTGYLAIYNNYLAAFALAAREGRFVDLDQSMINPGYLLGMPVHDLYNVAISAGEIIPLSHFVYTYRKWEFNRLLDLITDLRARSMQRQFHNFLEGIDFYFEFRQGIRDVARRLRMDRVIY